MRAAPWRWNGAERDLSNTRLVAPFDGYLTSISAALGKRLGVNDRVVRLLDQAQLDIQIHLSDADYGRLVSSAAGLRGRPVDVTWRAGDRNFPFRAVIQRADGEVDAASGGVRVYARIEHDAAALPLRPGAFVEVRIPDRVYRGATQLPETALVGGDTVYAVVDGRLEPPAGGAARARRQRRRGIRRDHRGRECRDDALPRDRTRRQSRGAMSQTGRGLIALFTRHRTAANLVMVLMILFGALGLARMNTQFFPTFAVEWVSVSVTWPGASAEDVDTNIVAAIEPEVRFLDGVKRVFAQSVEGIGSVVVEFEPGTNLDTALANVENAVDRVETLPEDSERPVVNRLYFYENIGNIVVSGPFSEAALRAHAKDIRERLLAAGVDKVDLFGSRREEIWVEVGEGRLRQLDLTLGDIASRIGTSSADQPSGIVPAGTNKQIRSLGLARSADEIGQVEIIAREDGAKVHLRDIATISERFNERDAVAYRAGYPAIELQVRRASTSDALGAGGHPR